MNTPRLYCTKQSAPFSFRIYILISINFFYWFQVKEVNFFGKGLKRDNFFFVVISKQSNATNLAFIIFS
ncbi:hypothetical protein RclHR1_02860016 [Rhizophagus clarus]|uniref:Uncharacterized protein n=1 Tax=Rhizophagus clarus TaxID=94130 RepID=A0A2Z6R3I7_9GLOM|nr:hypothetical protein RclHR1_02860016 [Rhizophagus clarus]